MGTGIEVIGWAGSIAILVAYALLATDRLPSRSPVYQLMNIGGGLGMAANGWAHGALPSVFNNLIWATIGGIALLRILRHRTN